MSTRNPAAVMDVEIIVRGDIPDSARAQARKMITHLARYLDLDEPILHARVRLTRTADPAVHRAVTAQASLDVNGRLIRAQIAAPTAHEGVDLLGDVLRHRMSNLARHWEARRGGIPKPAPHEWRHDSEPAHRPAYFPLPAEQRQVLRHKAYELSSCTPDEAIDDLEVMGYDFQLFTDIQSGQDSVVYRAGPTGYRIAQLHPKAKRHWRTAVPLSVSLQPAPQLDQAVAIERLNLTDLPFLFYQDKDSLRGNVLYRRYDGHYGIITPAT